MSAIRAAIILVVGAVGMTATFHPTFTSGFAQMQPDPGDAILNNYFLEHTYRWAFYKDYPHSFWSPGFFYPTPDTFTYSETLIGTAPVYWLLRCFMDESLAVQWWLLLLFATNYGACLKVLRWFGASLPLAIAGAYLFAFGLVRTDHLGHQHLMPHAFAPFAVWYAWQLLNEPTVRRWVLVLFFLTWQVFASLHLGWFLWFGLLLIGLLAIAAREPRARLVAWVKQRPFGVLVPAIIALVVVGLYAKNFYRGTPERRDYGNVVYYAPTWDAWFVAPDGSLWAKHLTPSTEKFDEVHLFHGLTAYIVLVLAVGHAWRTPALRRIVGVLLGGALLLALSVTQWGDHYSPWYVIHTCIPGANAFRAIGRMALMVVLLASIGGFVGLQAWLQTRRWSPRTQLLVAYLVLVAIMVEQYRAPRTAFVKAEHAYGPSVEWTKMLHGADVGYARFDGQRPDHEHHIVAMWAGLQANVPMMNGYSGTTPPNFPVYRDQPTLEELLTHLGANWEGTFILLDWGPPPRRYVFRITKGKDPAKRYVRLE